MPVVLNTNTSPTLKLVSIEDEKAPEKLYHYTNRKGLVGILESRSLWASHVRYLNDSEEFALAVKIAEEHLKQQQWDTPRELQVQELIEQLLPQAKSNADAYVFSASTAANSLSQWRAYCQPSDGYAIGFDTKRLLKMARPQKYFLAECAYSDRRHHESIAHLFGETRDELHKRIVGEELDFLAGSDLSASHFLALLLIVAPVLKDPSFADEQEWRFIVPGFSIMATRKYRPSKTLLIPYVTMGWGDDPSTTPITEIVIGPTMHRDLEAYALRSFLNNHNMSSVDVRHSGIPYRPE